MHVVNSTPWRTAFRLGLDLDGYETLTLVVKATYALRAGANDEQADVVLADEFHGEPGWSSVRRPHELAPSKLATDVLVSGFVYPLRSDPCRGGARLRCRNIDKMVEVVGERRWQPALLGHTPTRPLPFERMPLVYERAFGGRDDILGALEFDEHNPAGVGFRAVKSRREIANSLLPNIQQPGQPLRDPWLRIPPAGLGPVAAHWQPRKRYVGTYDSTWERDVAPLLPRDFDPRHHQQAPEGQILTGHLRAGERILLEGMSPEGPFDFHVPGASGGRLSIPVADRRARACLRHRLDRYRSCSRIASLPCLGAHPWSAVWTRLHGGANAWLTPSIRHPTCQW